MKWTETTTSVSRVQRHVVAEQLRSHHAATAILPSGQTFCLHPECSNCPEFSLAIERCCSACDCILRKNSYRCSECNLSPYELAFRNSWLFFFVCLLASSHCAIEFLVCVQTQTSMPLNDTSLLKCTVMHFGDGDTNIPMLQCNSSQ